MEQFHWNYPFYSSLHLQLNHSLLTLSFQVKNYDIFQRDKKFIRISKKQLLLYKSAIKKYFRNCDPDDPFMTNLFEKKIRKLRSRLENGMKFSIGKMLI
jgi:hypothetical protein